MQAGEPLRVRRDRRPSRRRAARSRSRPSRRPARPRSRPSPPAACAGRGRITSRSTTTEMSCLYFLSSTISSSSRRSSPSTFTRVKPSLRSSASCLPYSPLRPRTIGASTMNRVAVLQRHDLVDDLLGRLRGDRPAAVEAVRLADPRPQQAQVVVDLGDRADRRPRVARRRLLVDRDRRRQPLDRVDVRLVHLPEELARVRATATRRSGAGPRRRSCRTPATTCPSRTSPVMTTSESRGSTTVTSFRLCSRAPETTREFRNGT